MISKSPSCVTWNGQDLPLFLTPKHLVNILNLSRSIVYELLASGEIPSLKVGRIVRVQSSDFIAWIEGRKRSRVA